MREVNKLWEMVVALQGYAPLYNPFEQFFSRYVYRRVRHCFNRPICSAPGAEVLLKERTTNDYNWTFRYLTTARGALEIIVVSVSKKTTQLVVELNTEDINNG